MARKQINYGGTVTVRIREESVKEWLESKPKGFTTEIINMLLEKEMKRDK